tara:strand:+ start:1428 stop:2477 length:1050 start_codon:yes stop_codon:yes gene_type:complete
VTISDPIPVTVLTGFLGSGKTTILSRLVSHPKFIDTAVIVNEFGDVGLDHVLLEAAEENIIDLSCGCICCTIRGDLVSTLVDLYERREAGEIRSFQRVVLETTGLADPAPIIHTLMQDPLVFEHYRLARMVTTFDAINGMETLSSYPEAVKQVAVADDLVITKTDLVKDNEIIESLESHLAEINPSAEITFCINGTIDFTLLFVGGLYDPNGKGNEVNNWLSQEGTHRDHVHGSNPDTNRHGSDIQTFTLIRKDPVSRGALGAFMQMLADQKGDKLLRLKGLVLLSDGLDRPAVVHGIQHVIHPIRRLDAWPGGVSETRLVLVVRDIDQSWVSDLWDRVVCSAYADIVV